MPLNHAVMTLAVGAPGRNAALELLAEVKLSGSKASLTEVRA